MDKFQVYHDDGHQPLWAWDGYLASTINNRKVEIYKSAWKLKLKTYVVLSSHISVGDVINFDKIIPEYYIKNWIEYNPTGGIVFEIARLDGNRISQFDLDKLIVKTKGIIKGYVNKPKCNC